MAGHPIPGTTRRPIPRDFAERFAEFGWSEEIKAHYRVHNTTMTRWIRDYGEERLQAGRRAYLEAKYAADGKRIPGTPPGRKRAKRFVLGRTLAPVGCALIDGLGEE